MVVTRELIFLSLYKIVFLYFSSLDLFLSSGTSSINCLELFILLLYRCCFTFVRHFECFRVWRGLLIEFSRIYPSNDQFVQYEIAQIPYLFTMLDGDRILFKRGRERERNLLKI